MGPLGGCAGEGPTRDEIRTGEPRQRDFALLRRAGASSPPWASSPTSASRRERRESNAPDGHFSEAPSFAFATALVDARAGNSARHGGRVSRPAPDPHDHLGGSAFAEPPRVLRAVTSHQQPHQPRNRRADEKQQDRWHPLWRSRRALRQQSSPHGAGASRGAAAQPRSRGDVGADPAPAHGLRERCTQRRVPRTESRLPAPERRIRECQRSTSATVTRAIAATLGTASISGQLLIP